MNVKVSELSGAALDWAVCMALGMKPEDVYISRMGPKFTSLFRRNRDEDGALDGTYTTGPDLLFSRKWEAAGPIIERELIDTIHARGVWSAFHGRANGAPSTGPTPLIAAMRCFVASKLGDVVSIPDELM